MKLALLSSIFLMFNPFLLFFAQQGSAYSLLFLMSAINILIFHSKNILKGKWECVYYISSFLLIVSNFGGILLIFFNFIFYLLTKNKDKISFLFWHVIGTLILLFAIESGLILNNLYKPTLVENNYPVGGIRAFFYDLYMFNEGNIDAYFLEQDLPKFNILTSFLYIFNINHIKAIIFFFTLFFSIIGFFSIKSRHNYYFFILTLGLLILLCIFQESFILEPKLIPTIMIGWSIMVSAGIVYFDKHIFKFFRILFILFLFINYYNSIHQIECTDWKKMLKFYEAYPSAKFLNLDKELFPHNHITTYIPEIPMVNNISETKTYFFTYLKDAENKSITIIECFNTTISKLKANSFHNNYSLYQLCLFRTDTYPSLATIP